MKQDYAAQLEGPGWTENSFAGQSIVRCIYCHWRISTNQPSNALGRWAKLRAAAYKHQKENHRGNDVR